MHTTAPAPAPPPAWPACLPTLSPAPCPPAPLLQFYGDLQGASYYSVAVVNKEFCTDGVTLANLRVRLSGACFARFACIAGKAPACQACLPCTQPLGPQPVQRVNCRIMVCWVSSADMLC